MVEEMRKFKSACHLQRFISVHDQVTHIFQHCRYNRDAKVKRAARNGWQMLPPDLHCTDPAA